MDRYKIPRLRFIYKVEITCAGFLFEQDVENWP